ncbi:hypothetical protein [Halopiger djelfimassiliensis]|uniref:hypothetical protein n=1 Tax=Halopiger djelfimassiliensis TaxID=1293047 RepID=UPI000677D746|nr:hypothetical protein [Halopiger djelfimassiliensis]
MRSERVRFGSVRNRDVDLLILEELTVSAAFRSRVLKEIRERGADLEPPTLLESRYSPAGEDGSATVAFGVETADNERWLVYLRQPGDANPREPGGACGADDGGDTEWDERTTVLVGPSAQLERLGEAPAVDGTITYEQFRTWFTQRETPRGEYRAELLSAVIDSRGRGSPVEADGRLTELSRSYRTVATDRAPELGDVTLETSRSGAAGPRVEFDPPALAADHRLVHDLPAGHVELRVPGAAAHLETFAARYATVLAPETALIERGEDLSVRRTVPAIDPDGGGGSALEGREDAIAAGVGAASELLELSERMGNPTA